MIIKISKFHIVTVLAVVFVSSLIYGICTDRITVAVAGETVTELPVVMYHHLTEKSEKAGKYVLKVSELEADLKFLKERGYKTVTAGELLDFTQGRGTLPEKPIMLTFDDGFESVYAYAMPLLKEYGMTAEVFVVGSIADEYTAHEDHNLDYSYLNWKQIGEMSASGIFEIQNHSDALHSNTAGRNGMKRRGGESDAEYEKVITDDLNRCAEKILNVTGVSPTALAYPFGCFGKDTEKIVRGMGCGLIFTCEERVNAISKTDPEWCFKVGRFNRGSGVSTVAFFEKLGIA